jgi:hypothetical protein
MILRTVMQYSDSLRIRDIVRRWLGAPAPCGISHEDPYNPCLPEEDHRGLWCATCGLRQRPAITTGISGRPERSGDRS